MEHVRNFAQEFFWAALRIPAHIQPPRRGPLIPLLSAPSCSRLASSSTAKFAHARISRGERAPSQAQNFHETMKEKVT